MKTENWKLVLSVLTICGSVLFTSGSVLQQQKSDHETIIELKGEMKEQIGQMHDDQIVMKKDISDIKDTLQLAKSKGEITKKPSVNYIAMAVPTIAGSSATPTPQVSEISYKTIIESAPQAPTPIPTPQPQPTEQPSNEHSDNHLCLLVVCL